VCGKKLHIRLAEWIDDKSPMFVAIAPNHMGFARPNWFGEWFVVIAIIDSESAVVFIFAWKFVSAQQASACVYNIFLSPVKFVNVCFHLVLFIISRDNPRKLDGE
jgi:hypothetical protein